MYAQQNLAKIIAGVITATLDEGARFDEETTIVRLASFLGAERRPNADI